jgi:hypothetical protein
MSAHPAAWLEPPMTSRRPGFSARVLVELVCQREEATGHPYESPEADSAARAAGGSFSHRILARARSLPDAPELESSIRGVQRVALAFLGSVVLITFVAGSIASSQLLTAMPVNLPITLLALVGLNFATFLLWLLMQPFAQRLVGLAGGLNRLFRWVLSHRALRGIRSFFSHGTLQPGQRSNALDALNAIAAQGRGRWLFGAALHTVWLAFATGSFITLAILLSLRHYSLTWETTLLNMRSLSVIEHVFSAGPALLGIAGPAKFSVADTGTDAAGQYWSAWLLRAAFVYGVLPRLIALLACAALFGRAASTMGRDMTRLGFARLRTRLMPNSIELGILDPDSNPLPPQTPDALVAIDLKGRVHGIRLDAPDNGTLTLAGISWVWLDQDCDAIAHGVALKRLRNERVEKLAIVVRAAMTPDRGVERRVAELKAAAGTRTVLLLDGLDQLRKRGGLAYRNRVQQWRDLANRAGVAGILSAQSGSLVHDERGTGP